MHERLDIETVVCPECRLVRFYAEADGQSAVNTRPSEDSPPDTQDNGWSSGPDDSGWASDTDDDTGLL